MLHVYASSLQNCTPFCSLKKLQAVSYVTANASESTEHMNREVNTCLGYSAGAMYFLCWDKIPGFLS